MMPSDNPQTMQTLRAHNEFLEAAVVRLRAELRQAKADVKDLREARLQLERQVDALERVITGS